VGGEVSQIRKKGLAAEKPSTHTHRCRRSRRKTFAPLMGGKHLRKKKGTPAGRPLRGRKSPGRLASTRVPEKENRTLPENATARLLGFRSKYGKRGGTDWSKSIKPNNRYRFPLARIPAGHGRYHAIEPFHAGRRGEKLVVVRRGSKRHRKCQSVMAASEKRDMWEKKSAFILGRKKGEKETRADC